MQWAGMDCGSVLVVVVSGLRCVITDGSLGAHHSPASVVHAQVALNPAQRVAARGQGGVSGGVLGRGGQEWGWRGWREGHVVFGV